MSTMKVLSIQTYMLEPGSVPVPEEKEDDQTVVGKSKPYSQSSS